MWLWGEWDQGRFSGQGAMFISLEMMFRWQVIWGWGLMGSVQKGCYGKWEICEKLWDSRVTLRLKCSEWVVRTWRSLKWHFKEGQMGYRCWKVWFFEIASWLLDFGAFVRLSCGLKGKYIKDLELGFGLNLKKSWMVILWRFQVEVLGRKCRVWDLSSDLERLLEDEVSIGHVEF